MPPYKKQTALYALTGSLKNHVLKLPQQQTRKQEKTPHIEIIFFNTHNMLLKSN